MLPVGWTPLQRLTAARIGQPRTGASLATAPLLDFRLAHARARDAVHTTLDEPALLAALPGAILIDSQATDRRTYLMRPDLGRRLAPGATDALTPGPYDLAIVLGEGLSALAVQRHAAPLIAALSPALAATNWVLAPTTIIRGARVAAADAAAIALGAAAVLMLIGERPGLSAPDSLGAYLTWAPTATTLDSARNCVSNIRPEGLSYNDAAYRLFHLLQRMRSLRLSGVALKDESGRDPAIQPPDHKLFTAP